MLYFIFNIKPASGEVPSANKKKSFWRKLRDKFDRWHNPNPDFDKMILYVAKWYLEYDDECDCSWREIGLDCHNNIIVKMPDDNNYGFWLDTNCTIDDFRKMSGFKMITEQEFNDLWNSVKYDRKAGVFRPNCNAR